MSNKRVLTFTRKMVLPRRRGLSSIPQGGAVSASALVFGVKGCFTILVLSVLWRCKLLLGRIKKINQVRSHFLIYENELYWSNSIELYHILFLLWVYAHITLFNGLVTLLCCYKVHMASRQLFKTSCFYLSYEYAMSDVYLNKSVSFNVEDTGDVVLVTCISII